MTLLAGHHVAAVEDAAAGALARYLAMSRNVSGVLAWQFDRRNLHRTGAAPNYGGAVVRCIWPLAGEHSEQIASTLCGLGPARIAELSALGVFR